MAAADKSWRDHVDAPSLVTIIITLVLFVIAVFEKGMTHDLLLEAGVFLVSVKLILMSYKQGVNAAKLQDQLTRIEQRIGSLTPPPTNP